MNRAYLFAGRFLLLTGFALMLANVYGELRGIRVAESIPHSDLRFVDDVTIPYAEVLERVERLDEEAELTYAARVTKVVQGGLAHLDAWYEHPADRYLQRVPFYENFLLNFLGHYSGLPQIERYHFTDYRRSFERGIGLCGDHAMIMSQLLDREGIDSTLLAFPAGHVIIEVRDADGISGVFDADFGVGFVGFDRTVLGDDALVASAYRAEGYSEEEIEALLDVYGSEHKAFGGTYEFMGKRYVFERVSYVLKWVLPIALAVLGVTSTRYARRRDAVAGMRTSTADIGV